MTNYWKLLTLLMGYTYHEEFRISKLDELKGIDIKKEMKLIKQKKSNLSARLRREVQFRFEENEIKEEN